MLGVVLWSDAGDNKAVIWCEDHGDLAYFNGGVDDPASLMDFDAGDLVHLHEIRAGWGRAPMPGSPIDCAMRPPLPAPVMTLLCPRPR